MKRVDARSEQSVSKGFYRLPQIIGDRKANPPIEPLLPISRSAFYAGIKKHIYPAPIRLSARVSLWRVEDITRLLEDLGNNKSN
ncbi:AlpA family transcriptional regulator [Desulfopila sp. IMCC35006]|nr:AlpA family transcriptional regulator [Desulfopila sp. IMCC35006]